MNRNKRKRKSLFKDKKGGIPAINELVMTILNVTPRPILLLIFVLLITTIASFIIPVFLNLFGYECVIENGEPTLYKIPITSFSTELVTDLRQGFRDAVGISDFKLADNPFPFGSKNYMRIPETCMHTTSINGSSVYGYTYACSNCTFEPLHWYNAIIGIDKDAICVTDGYYKEIGFSYSPSRKNYCYLCSPPNPYFYNHSTCFEFGECMFQILPEYSVDDVLDTYDYYLQRVKELGGVKITHQQTELVNIQCVAEGKPQMYVFNIELFNKTMWTILIASYFLIGFVWGYYKLFL